MTIPKTAYILLWFPKPSETFIFSEILVLKSRRVPLQIFTLYGPLKKNLGPEMNSIFKEVERLGAAYLFSFHKDLFFWIKKKPDAVLCLLRSLLVKPWYGFEKTGENLWAFICAMRLARRFINEGIGHIHAPWACGPATAAWIASRLTGIPFSFTARAHDIYPPDGVLKEKIQDAACIRSETMYNIDYLSKINPGGKPKMFLTRNGVPLSADGVAAVHMTPPFKLLAVGRFVGKKGYEHLIRACHILKSANLDFHLVLAGDGPLNKNLRRLTKALRLTDSITFPGFVPHHKMPALFLAADIFIMPCVIDPSKDRDGLPTVIMESLLHSVPVIAGNVSGVSELIEHGKTGLLIPPGDPAAIARAVVQLAGNRSEALRLAERGRKRVLEQFHPETNGDAVLELYRKIFSRFQPEASG